GLAAELVAAVEHAETPCSLGAEAVAEPPDHIPVLRRGCLRPAPRRRVVVRPREVVDIAVQRPEVPKGEVRGRLDDDVLAIPTEVPPAPGEHADGAVLEPPARG